MQCRCGFILTIVPAEEIRAAYIKKTMEPVLKSKPRCRTRRERKTKLRRWEAKLLATKLAVAFEALMIQPQVKCQQCGATMSMLSAVMLNCLISVPLR